MTDLLWQPSQARVAGTTLTRFMAHAHRACGFEGNDYDDLWAWSIDRPEAFWRGVWDFSDMRGAAGDLEPVLDHADDLVESRFFPNVTLNFAENLMRRRGPEAAIIFHGEDGSRRELSWDQVHDRVARLSRVLRDMGLSRGDRVAGFMPNLPETVIALLATSSIGAVWSSCSPDFGVSGILDRFGQIEPKILICANGYHYNGKQFDCLATVSSLLPQLPTVEAVLVVPYTEARADLTALGGKAHHWDETLDAQSGDPIPFEPVGFNDPLVIMFSSGTTGIPKCIVHRTGGVLLQHLKEHRLQCDLGPGDRLFYFTTCGWMMWNWLVSGLACEATIVLFDGSPFYPDGNRLAAIADAERVTHFGTSAKYLDACAKGGIAPARTHDLSALRTLLSTGSPLSPDGFEYVYRDWKADLCLSSIAGGTDIVGCFVGGNPIGPVYLGQCQKRHLGMDVQVFDESGATIAGVPGELICRSPHPSMPWGFWNDPDKKRYRAAYFEKYPGVWHHGDRVELTREGGMIFHGRSDATLNPGGVRIGTAEIYRQVERIPEVLESIVVGQEWDNDVRVVLFVRLREDAKLNDVLIQRIRAEVRANTTPRHVPAKVLEVADIPRTKSGKIVELAVRDVIHGREVRNIHALANPEALALFKDREELQR
ncbi:acetoacetate--CoA ligase [Magnetospira sp. QH-2]|uniref:acetoacetate--CoA ligase n=1 Tax=Magnetospira sp. (strain QH-2) TaxID=1288970 RepID=UPI0003E815F6|nr:acetoacetate--CoA ligase [Magnetospira sp. QH-2]CCQ72524.1 Acetoacetyl-coenzyme A synthetase [Magnetospira sp. QH-2]